ncbi:uncharacterized protein LOC123635662 isoform X2 [Lemur catta]|uniref:uncharacterized protein LOC123635662 isoform X2 n=1 Tax=Lemur catta TaxID=9447 RepID=UPI001E269FD5|nr:uncharacterized protein LOC123635662 isoform X2 [Lemur catta]
MTSARPAPGDVPHPSSDRPQMFLTMTHQSMWLPLELSFHKGGDRRRRNFSFPGSALSSRMSEEEAEGGSLQKQLCWEEDVDQIPQEPDRTWSPRAGTCMSAVTPYLPSTMPRPWVDLGGTVVHIIPHWTGTGTQDSTPTTHTLLPSNVDNPSEDSVAVLTGLGTQGAHDVAHAQLGTARHLIGHQEKLRPREGQGFVQDHAAYSTPSRAWPPYR